MTKAILRICILAGLLAAMPVFAFLQAMPDAPTVPQGAMNERAALAGRLEPRQNIGDTLPLDVPLVDSSGRAHRLGDWFDGTRPVVVVLGYYRCPNLCGTVMQGVLEALAATGLPREQWRLVYVSIDPEETPEVAAQHKVVWDGYARFADERATHPMELNMLVGTAAASRAISTAAGFAVESTDPAPGATLSRYAHDAEFFVATPRGRISQYFMGVRFDARDLRLSMVSASEGGIGSLADRLVLLCSHFDPASGRYNVAVMNGLRVVGIATVLALLGWGWRHRRTAPAAETPIA